VPATNGVLLCSFVLFEHGRMQGLTLAQIIAQHAIHQALEAPPASSPAAATA
jgi:hypothetical protein